ncbi:MAG: PilN domain-containing protein [Nitrospirota bacterium]
MIKVNLLGVERPKRARRTGKGPGGLVSVVAVALLLIGGMGFVWWSMVARVNALEQEKVALNEELNALKAKVKEVENYEKNKKDYEEKIGIIEQLRKNQTGPVRLLDELSRHLPDRVWLTSLTEQGGKVDLEGRAVTNAEIVEYINNLKASNHIKEIQLIESRQVSEGGIPVYNFKLKCLLVV